MIISASRRTDIPAFYSAWFMNRLQAGYCTVVQPMNHHRVYRVSLKPEDVDAIVFWTKNPEPLMPRLKELDNEYACYFLYTITSLPLVFEPGVPPLKKRIDTFRELSEKLGPDRVIWRFDPIIISTVTPAGGIPGQFAEIAHALRGFTKKVIISYVDNYRGVSRQFKKLESSGIVVNKNPDFENELRGLITGIRETAEQCGMVMESCVEDFAQCGVLPGRCVDPVLVSRLSDRQICPGKDPGQRKECSCALSRDIGFYDSCRFGCVYCYATHSARNSLVHDEHSPSLLGWFEENQ